MKWFEGGGTITSLDLKTALNDVKEAPTMEILREKLHDLNKVRTLFYRD